MPANRLIAGRLDRLRTGTPRSYGCPAKSFSDKLQLLSVPELKQIHLPIPRRRFEEFRIE
jgi:hypothetical protein